MLDRVLIFLHQVWIDGLAYCRDSYAVHFHFLYILFLRGVLRLMRPLPVVKFSAAKLGRISVERKKIFKKLTKMSLHWGFLDDFGGTG